VGLLQMVMPFRIDQRHIGAEGIETTIFVGSLHQASRHSELDSKRNHHHQMVV